jgi:hypothetical protein
VVRTADDIEVSVQHAATDAVTIGERLRIALVPTPVMAEAVA